MLSLLSNHSCGFSGFARFSSQFTSFLTSAQSDTLTSEFCRSYFGVLIISYFLAESSPFLSAVHLTADLCREFPTNDFEKGFFLLFKLCQ
jgi:hypothetical protein